MAKKPEQKLKQTKSLFKVTGRATRLDKDGAYREDVGKPGTKKEGVPLRALRFGVKTSDDNEITVSMFDYEPEKVFLWNSELRKEDENYKGEQIAFGDWEDRKEDLKEQGYAVLQTRIGVTYDEKGKIVSEGLPSYVASELIFDELSNGDSVTIEGEIRYSRYKNQKGEEKEQTTYTIKKLFKHYEDIDFDDAEFEEVSYFEQEFVFIDETVDKEDGKQYIIGRTIDFAGNFIDTQFVVKFKDDEGKTDPDMVKLVSNVKDKLAFGDLVTVFGQAQNRVILKEVEAQEEEEDLFASFGGRKKPKHAEKYTAKDYITEMTIEGVDAVKKEAYVEEDFIKDEGLVEEDKKSDNDFGGKKKPDKKSPFEKVDDDPFASNKGPIEVNDDDLPF